MVSIGLIIFGVIGWGLSGLVGLMYINYWSQVRKIVKPYMEVKKSKGKKLLLLIDTGVDKFDMVAAKKEALGYTAEGYGNFEAYEEGIKGFHNVPMGLAHAELEVMIPPRTAVWLEQHGKDISREEINNLPDIFQYLACANDIEEEKNGKTEMVPCGWIGPLLPMTDTKSILSVAGFVEKLKKLSEDDKNIIFPKPKEPDPIPLCPDCDGDVLRVETDSSVSTIPRQPVVYNLSNVRAWVDEVASPLNMDMAIEQTKINTMKSMQNSLDKALPWIMVLTGLIMTSAIAVVIINSVGGGDVSGGGDAAKNIVGGIGL